MKIRVLQKDGREEHGTLARPPVQARWKSTGVLGLGFIPN
jgi:hypothetical protein